jgi:hypothetical protein
MCPETFPFKIKPFKISPKTIKTLLSLKEKSLENQIQVKQIKQEGHIPFLIKTTLSSGYQINDSQYLKKSIKIRLPLARGISSVSPKYSARKHHELR